MEMVKFKEKAPSSGCYWKSNWELCEDSSVGEEIILSFLSMTVIARGWGTPENMSLAGPESHLQIATSQTPCEAGRGAR